VRKSVPRLAIASYIIEIIEGMTAEQEPAPELFKLLGHVMNWLHEEDEANFEKQAAYLLSLCLGKILQIDGTQPRFHECRTCKKSIGDSQEHLGFSATPDFSALICAQCAPSLLTPASLRREDLLNIQFGLGYPLKKALELNTCEPTRAKVLFHWMENYANHQLPGVDIHSLKARPLVLEALNNSGVLR